MLKKIVFFPFLCTLLLSACTEINVPNNTDSTDENTCVADYTRLTITKEPVNFSIVSLNHDVTLTCEACADNRDIKYQWYKSLDGTTQNATEIISTINSHDSTITIPCFDDTTIHYYFCKITALPVTNRENIEKEEVTSRVVSVAFTGLPTLYLDTGDIPTSKITKETYVPTCFTLIMPDGTEINRNMTKKGIKGRGNSSWKLPKKGYNLNFDNKESFFGLSESKKWCIVSNYLDRTLLHNNFSSILGKNIFNSEWNPTFQSIDVIMNGEYLGNYIFCEKNTIDEGRIEIQDISKVEENINKGKLDKVIDTDGDGIKSLGDGGFVLEIDIRHDADFYFDTESLLVPVTLKEPDLVSEEIKERIIQIVQTAQNVLYANNFTDPYIGWRHYIDETSMIDWYLVNEFSKNDDANFRTSVYMYYNPSDQKIHMGPNWDFDSAYGNTSWLSSPTGWFVKDAKWISRLFEDSSFIINLQKRWKDKKSDLYNIINGNNSFSIQQMANTNSVSAEINFSRWKILGYTLEELMEDKITEYKNSTTYQYEVSLFIEWCNNRFTWLDTEINSLQTNITY